MKKALMAALVAATSLSTPSIAYVGDTFIGENGGVRVVQSISFEGDIANIEVETTNSRGRVKTRTFHVRRDETGQYQADSRGTPEFQQFLIDQAQEARDAIVEQEFTITAENTTIWELADMFPHLDILAFTDGIDLNEEETRELVAAGVDLDSFWFTYDLSYVDYVPTFTFNDGLTITDEGTGTPVYLESPLEFYHTSADSYRAVYGKGVYEQINLNGLEQAHRQGWTGSSQTNLSVLTPHGTYGYVQNDPTTLNGNNSLVHDIRYVAPNSDINYIGNNDYSQLADADIVIDTHGVRYEYQSARTLGYTIPQFPTDEERKAEYLQHYNNLIESADEALIVLGSSITPNASQVEERPTGVYYTYYGHYATRVSYEGCEINTVYGWINRVTQDSCTSAKWLYDSDADLSRTIFAGRASVNVPGYIDVPFTPPGERAKNDFILVPGTVDLDPRVAVAGVAALVQHKFGTSAENTKKIILETADDYGPTGPDASWGYGVLNLERALAPVGSLR